MLSRRIYYHFKPFLPWSVRMTARRLRAKRTRVAAQTRWPVQPASARAPEGWRGWPDGQRFAFVLTHDVEGPEGQARCQRLAELEASLGFRSSFNFIPEGSYPDRPDLRARLANQGFEIGIHDLRHDGLLYSSRAAFHEHARRINHYLKDWGATGFRSGFMLHELDWLHELDIEYDASTFDTDPFEPQPDGAGTIYPFWVTPPADLAERRGYLELPYTLPQDSTLFLLLRETSPDIWISKLDWIAQHGGMALVNVHPDYLQFPDEPARPRTFPIGHYVSLLEHVRDGYAGQYWHPLPGALARAITPNHPHHRPQRKKRACVVSYSFYENDSRVFRYSEALAESGVEVDVLCLRSSSSLPREQLVRGCRVVRLQDRSVDEKSPSIYLWRLLRFLFRSSRWIARQHGKFPYDILHFHNVPDFLVFAGYRPKLGGAKIILDIHDIVPELYKSKFGAGAGVWTLRTLKWMERASAAFADHVILANDLWLDLYARRSAPRKKLSVLINYVDRRVFHRRSRQRQDGRKIVIFPGSLQTHQGLDVAIRAFPRVVAAVPAAELHIYGEGPAKPLLISLTAELGLNGAVRFFSPVPTMEIAAIMAEADLGVVPKRADSFGNEAYSTKILEFMSLGVPVVASSTKIDRFYFDDSIVRFFPSGDSVALADSLVDLLSRPDAGRAMAERATEYADRNSWENHKGEYLQLVDRLCVTHAP